MSPQNHSKNEEQIYQSEVRNQSVQTETNYSYDDSDSLENTPLMRVSTLFLMRRIMKMRRQLKRLKEQSKLCMRVSEHSDK